MLHAGTPLNRSAKRIDRTRHIARLTAATYKSENVAGSGTACGELAEGAEKFDIVRIPGRPVLSSVPTRNPNTWLLSILKGYRSNLKGLCQKMQRASRAISRQIVPGAIFRVVMIVKRNRTGGRGSDGQVGKAWQVAAVVSSGKHQVARPVQNSEAVCILIGDL